MKKEEFAKLIKSNSLIYTMGAHNGLSAKLAERNGFDAVWASGLEISASYAVPDANILTMTQYLEKSCEMNEAISLPVVCDCDTGYGNSNNVIYLVKKYEAAGMAAICLEDKLFPKANSFIKGRQELAPIAEFVGKIMAAKSTQRSENFKLIARVEALIAGWDESEALLRAEKYVEAGADAILIHSKQSHYDQIISFAKKWGKQSPLVIVPTTYPTIMKDLTEEELLGLGIKMVIFANQGIRASIKVMNDVMSRIRKMRHTCAVEKDIVSMGEVFELQGMTQMNASERKYLKTATEEFNAIFLAAGGPHNQDDLAPLLRDRPVALLDINGQSLLKRNVSTISKFNVDQITVVTGYCSEQFNLEGVSLIHNLEYNEKNILHSLMLAEEKLTGRVLLAYADVFFEKEIVEKLLKTENDIVLVGDPTFKNIKNTRNSKLDLLITDSQPNISHRSIDDNYLPKVLKIGDHIAEENAHYEFVGLAFLSEKGIGLLREVYHDMKDGNPGHKHKDFDKMTINDVLQEIINRKFPIHVLKVNSGWVEIHSFENYRLACSSIK